MGQKDRSTIPQVLVDGARSDLDERTLDIIKNKHSVKFYPRSYSSPRTVLITSLVLGLPLLGFAAYLAYHMLTHDNDFGSTVFYLIVIAGCLGGCAACVRWFLRSSKRAESTRAGELADGIYIASRCIIFYDNDEHIHVIPREGFVSRYTATLMSSSGNRPHQDVPAFTVKDGKGEIHWYLYVSSSPYQEDFMSLLEKWGVPYLDEKLNVSDEIQFDNYYNV